MGVTVTVNDLRAAGMCPAAAPWFARNGLDWRVFITQGYDEDVLRATGDAMAVKVCDLAVKRVAESSGT